MTATPTPYGAAAGGRDAARVPVRRLTVLHDARCPLCTHLRDWLTGRRQLVPLDLVPAGSDEARRRLPDLDHDRTLEEITVVGDAGQVYRGPAAWTICLWALDGYRPSAHRLGTPVGARPARGTVLAAAKYRETHRRQQECGGRSCSTADGRRYDPAQGWSRTGPDGPPSCGGSCPAPG
ncbi:DUF393 domain-containing protein [Streptomyces carminius]|uniref:DUF393 domain-containing protein n=1 Tax=Streptomyces carminius TaxID=2665496 RepID=A0A2M8LX73_9ACTN|nr:DCC1-like thiol-disulfide oxidoreductase family protein [Streptomyces carminius]PJE96567.1 DUF393 domain-containing protein [Streptomyces carminius]